MVHLELQKEYKHFLSNGFAVGIESVDTLENILKDTVKCSEWQNTMQWLHIFINGEYVEVGKTGRVYGEYTYNYEFFFNEGFTI